MGSASGDPSEMLAYYGDASGQVEEWRDEVPKLRSALDRLPGEETRQLAEPFTTGFAHATSSLEPDIYAQLLDFGSITDPTAQSVHLATAPHRPRSHQTSYDRVKPR